jgi:hypothetical protein
MANVARDLLGLNLSASELHEEHPEWTDVSIEDYLNKDQNINMVAEGVDTGVDIGRRDLNRSYFYGRVY